MKEIKLKIDDNVFSKIRSTMSLKMMSGSAYGVADAALVKLVEAIEDGKEELKFKNEDKNERS